MQEDVGKLKPKQVRNELEQENRKDDGQALNRVLCFLHKTVVALFEFFQQC